MTKYGINRVLITGATGMVGGFVLKQLLTDPSVEEVISIGRRETGIKDDKLREIIHPDFLSFSGIEDQLTGIDVCIYCLGVYQPHVSKEKFFEITCNYQKALTDVLEKTSPDLTFVLFSAQGADPVGNSKVTFARGKGQAEKQLSETVFPKKYIFRPGYIHPTGKKRPEGFMYKIMLPLAALLYKFFPSMGIDDRDLARAMVKTGLEGTKEPATYENKQIRYMM